MLARMVKTTALMTVCLPILGLTTCQPSGDGTRASEANMKPILASYLEVQRALAADSIAGVQPAARSIAKQAAGLKASGITGEHAEHYAHLPMKLERAAKTLSEATTIEAARAAFKQLSMPMATWGSMSKPDGIDVLYCSMAKGSWLQVRGDVKNPYLGARMLGCGEVVKDTEHSGMKMGRDAHGSHGGHGEKDTHGGHSGH